MANVAYLLPYGALYIHERRRVKKGHLSATENIAVLSNLSKNNPQNNYYVIGKVDKKGVEQEYIDELFPNKNVFFTVQDNFLINGNLGFFGRDYNEKAYEILDKMVDYFTNTVKLDYGISISGFRKAMLPGITRKKTNIDETMYCLCDCVSASCYALYLVNKTNLPYIIWSNDTRHMNSVSNTLTNPEKHIVGFKNGKIKIKHHVSLEKEEWNIIKETEVESTYGYMDYLTIVAPYFQNYNREKIDFQSKKDLVLYLNPCPEYDRLSVVNKYILSQEFPVDVKIYGDWFKKYPELKSIDAFKGKKDQYETYEILEKAKYNFIVPSHTKDEGITALSTRFWETIWFGVIPFIHKGYGASWWKNIHHIPNYLWVNSPEELVEKIEELENNEVLYNYIIGCLNILVKEANFEKIEGCMKNAVEKYCNTKW